jgi:hypothetical protein
LLKNGVKSPEYKVIARESDNQDTGYWMLDAGRWRRSRSAGVCAVYRSSSIHKIDRIPR